ncbi:MAG: hypothetical protein ACQETQ_08745 [Spirochaetota bacterium]
MVEQLDSSRWFSTAPVTWSLPSYGILDQPTVVEALSRRVASAGDVPACGGYTGSPHPLLLAKELEYEVSRGLKNEEQSGVLDVFPQSPRLLLASDPDSRRPEAAHVYSTYVKAFSRGISPAKKASPRLLFAVDGHDRSLPVLRADATKTEDSLFSRLRALLKQQGSGVVVVVNAVTGDSVERLDGALTRISPHTARVVLSGMEPQWVDTHGNRPEASVSLGEPAACRPNLIRTSTTVNRLRFDYPENPQRVLETMSDERTVARFEGPCDGNPPPGRTLHASMMGTVSLQMDPYEVQFSRGRLSRFGGGVGKKRTQLLADPVGGKLRTAKHSYEITPSNAFSFDDAATGARGLMSIHSLSGEEIESPGRLMVDYTAIEDFPWLIVEMCFEFPVLSAAAEIKELIPFALPIRVPEGREAQTLTTRYPDGTGSRLDLSEVSGAGCAFGSLVQIENHLSISCLTEYRTITAAFPFEKRRALGGSTLTLYPFGRFRSEAVLERAGTASRVRFALSVGSRDYEEILNAPEAVLKESSASSQLG